MKKIIEHFKLWNEWRKGCLNGPLHKFLVLIGVVHSPTFHFFKEFKDWSIEVPGSTVQYDEVNQVAYICDGKACTRCDNPDCKHTVDIRHARNFERGAENKYAEKERDYQKFADEVIEMLNMYCDDGNEIYIKKRVLEVNMKYILEEFE